MSRLLLLGGRGLDREQDFALLLADGIHLEALLRLRALARGQVELVRVEGADDDAGADHALRERRVLVRAAVLGGEDPAVALPEDGDLLAGNEEAEALALGDLLEAPQVHRALPARDVVVSHCFPRPPGWRPARGR